MFRRDLIRENSKKLSFALASLLVLILICSCVFCIETAITRGNDADVAAVLEALSYTEDAAESELERLVPFTGYEYLSVSERGQLYRAMAELSYMTGDDMEYNRYIACALYYLKIDGNTDGSIYLTNKYIGRLYANGCYNSAEELLRDMAEVTDIESLSPDIRAGYYLSVADVAEMLGNDASDALSNASDAIQMMPEGGNKLLDRAKYDLLMARRDIENNDFAGAKERIAGYSASDDFGLGKRQVYVICDFLIPYLEITAKVQLHDNDMEDARQSVDRYLELCDDFQFRAMKLRLLQYAANHDVSRAGVLDRYRVLKEEVASDNLDEMIEEYGKFLLYDIKNTQKDLAAEEESRTAPRRGFIWALAIVYAAIAIYCVTSIFMDYVNKDGLTRLNCRKRYESICHVCEKKKIPYCLLMIDIDDFKSVNDTFGHERGDDVLRKISSILMSYTGRGISAYRYGGEELCLFFMRVPEERSRQIAEEIRSRIEKTVSVEDRRITISGGIAVSTNGENVFQQADGRLYESKKSGKNRIS